ncbi:ammonium transporter [Actinomadura parmotrematis]|uniref:Ammonium transporter n=1 Tax=Actinomadura parmotrematis TaxID=2864039 RepID=A0ABS7G0M4_9ACTN|nr:ammonium transporter [Actinomadura parmotrematis]MBW8486041.1 ammonium transporter [Actinomadura parmotrematis]
MKIDTGATAWMLAATALVLLMTPGLAFFYGGMTRAKSVLNMMMMSFGAIISVTILWVLFGHSIAFTDNGNTAINKFMGGFDAVGLKDVATQVSEGLLPDQSDNIPTMVFSAFQLTFAIITVALISGAIADRAKFGAWMVFSVVWASLVYFPVAHWVWGTGWLNKLGIEDFAGGTVVHVNAGAAGLALALVLGKRRGWPKEPMRPHNLPFVLLGAGILWFGWFGFNAGSELAVDGTTGLAFMNTQIATAVAAGAWILVEKLRDGHATTLGVASGAVAGLVAITPACGFVDPWAAIVLGAIAGAACAFAVGLKYKLGYDDSLDVVGVHLVGGAIGAVSLGFIAKYPFLDSQHKGLFYGGGVHQLGLQALGPVAVGLYSFIMAWIIGTIIDKTIGFRLDEEDEVTGIDVTTHAESAYDLAPAHGGGGSALGSAVAAASPERKVQAEA